MNDKTKKAVVGGSIIAAILGVAYLTRNKTLGRVEVIKTFHNVNRATNKCNAPLPGIYATEHLRITPGRVSRHKFVLPNFKWRGIYQMSR